MATGNEAFEDAQIINEVWEDQEQIINEEVKISDFAFTIFEELRELDGITNETIQQSLGPLLNNKAVFKAGESQGKSGSFFFFSHDRKFIIKTMF